MTERIRLPENDVVYCEDELNRVEISYHSETKIKSAVRPSYTEQEPVTVVCSELLVIDRNTETIEHTIQYDECSISHRYYIPVEVSELLDSLSEYELTQPAEAPPDIIPDPYVNREYEVLLCSVNGNQTRIAGEYYEDGLPDEWSGFIWEIEDYISNYHISNLFSVNEYAQTRRRESDHIVCNVSFCDSGNTYAYLADDDTICEGDHVVVPAGRNNLERTVLVESVKYCQESDLPLSLERLKRVIRKCDETELGNGYEVPSAADTADMTAKHKFESLTQYIEPLECVALGEWITDNANDGASGQPIQMPYVKYTPLVMAFQREVYKFSEKHPRMGLGDYHDILSENHIDMSKGPVTDDKLGSLDARCVTALILFAVRAERFCDGALLTALQNGSIAAYLRRLKEIDDAELATSTQTD